MMNCDCGKRYTFDSSLSGQNLRCVCGRVISLGLGVIHHSGAMGADSQRRVIGSGSLFTEQNSGLLAIVGTIASLWLWSCIPTGAPVSRSGYETQPAPYTSPNLYRSAKPLPLPQTPAPRLGCDLPNLRRPRSGAELGPKHFSGLSELRVTNNNFNDAVVLLKRTRDHRAERAMYVRSQESASMTRIRPGSYRLYFRAGERWSVIGAFCAVAGTSVFEQVVHVEEVPQGDGTILYSTFTVTLHPIEGGNARTTAVDSTEFELTE